MLPQTKPPANEVVVLVAEDDADDREILCEVIDETARNIVVVFVHDGEELIRYVRGLVLSKPILFPDLVLLDVNMPKVTGSEALRMLKEAEETKDVPVAMLTTSSDPALKKKLLGLGACGFYSKPHKMSEYKRLIIALLDECLNRPKPD